MKYWTTACNDFNTAIQALISNTNIHNQYQTSSISITACLWHPAMNKLTDISLAFSVINQMLS